MPRERRNDRHGKNAKWVESLRSSDVNRLWTDLHRIVSHHPLVRASRSAGLLVEEGSGAAYTDLTQELFVQLLSKNRFEHYLETNMTDYEIECEISQIELTNLLTAELRKRHPESYRLARRISTLIQSSPLIDGLVTVSVLVVAVVSVEWDEIDVHYRQTRHHEAS